jgi:hypothetical protein
MSKRRLALCNCYSASLVNRKKPPGPAAARPTRKEICLLGPSPQYHRSGSSSPSDCARPERRGNSKKRPIDEAKAKVPVIDLTDLLAGLGRMRRIGKEWVTNCLLPDHDDRVPSFTVNPVKNLWFCHGCACAASRKRPPKVVAAAMTRWR